MLYIIVKGSMEKFQEELFLYSESALNIVSYIKYMFIREKKGNYWVVACQVRPAWLSSSIYLVMLAASGKIIWECLIKDYMYTEGPN